MGAHHKVDVTRRQVGVDLPFLCGGHGPGEQTHPHPSGGEQGGQGAEVLLGQHLGGGHHGRLKAPLHCQPPGVGGHHRLALAHVPLDQPVHGSAAGHVPGGLLHGPALGIGGLEGEQGGEFRPG